MSRPAVDPLQPAGPGAAGASAAAGDLVAGSAPASAPGKGRTFRLPRRAVVAAALAVFFLLGVELGILGGFLSGAGVTGAGVTVPVGVPVAVLGNLAVGILASWGTRLPWAAAVPGLAWFATVLALGQRRREGDLVVTGQGRPLAFLVLGTVAVFGALVIGSRVVRAGPRLGTAPK